MNHGIGTVCAGVITAAGTSGAACAQTACPRFEVAPSAPALTAGESLTLTLNVLTGVRMTTNQGMIDISLMLDTAPNTSDNFLRYVLAGRYDGTIFHRSVPMSVQSQIGVIQGGGYTAPTAAITEWAPPTPAQTPTAIDTFAPIALEHPVGNMRGTIAMARTSDPHSATSQFFINTVDNNIDVPGERFSLDAIPGSPTRPGYAVFGTLSAPSLTAVDGIAARWVADVSWLFDDFALSTVPLRRPFAEEVTLPLLPEHYVTVSSATPTVTPAGGWPQGAGLIYRWKNRGVIIADGGRYSGAATPTLMISDATIAEWGAYTCEVTGLPCGTVASPEVVVRCASDLGAAGGEAAPDGQLNNNDFVVFIDLFFGHDPRADLGRVGGERGADGAFDNNDFVAFIDLFFSGC
ncbi:MAG TPA: peptidylprolyl isomerase [Phycisphaerales bacterium]|nr:peptidylprolyl isomerase [Phycisphaerales bacterium]